MSGPVGDTTDNSNLTYVLRIDVVDQELKKRAARRYANWFTARLHALFESQEEPKMNDHPDPPIGDTTDADEHVEELSAEHRDRVWKDRAGNVWRWVDCRWEYERPDSAVFYSPATMQNSDMGPFTLARPVGDTTDRSDEIAELCRILNSVGIDTLDGEDGPLIEALMAWKFSPVGDTTQPADESHICESCGGEGHTCDTASWPTQPQPTDDANWSDPSQVPSKARRLSRKPADDGHGEHCGGCRELALLTAVAEIRVLHQPYRDDPQHWLCRICKQPYPCPTIRALDKAGAQ